MSLIKTFQLAEIIKLVKHEYLNLYVQNYLLKQAWRDLAPMFQERNRLPGLHRARSLHPSL